MDKRTNDLVLKIQDFRAIKNAEIILDGITVVAGVNGSGKSTISKVLYHFLKTVIHYDEAIREHFEEERKMDLSALHNLFMELKFFSFFDGQIAEMPQTKYIETVFAEYNSLYSSNNYNNSQELLYDGKNLNTNGRLNQLIDTLIKYVSDEVDLKSKKRLLMFLKNGFKVKAKNIETGFLELKEYFDQKSSKIEYFFKKRPSILLLNNIYRIFNQKIQVNIEAGGIDLADYQNDSLFSYPKLNNIAYFDSPMLLGVIREKPGFEHWEDLNKILSKSKYNGGFSSDLDFNKSISDIIGGNTSSDENYSKSFIYQRKDGKRFNLLDCATGLKSFSMIQMLVQNGFISKRTLLIIDEPEAHLHPQWVVEYARLLVLLNKHTGCKFLIASHHPDMISALKYISKAEGIQDNFNLYFAEESDEEYKYNFENQNGSLEKVFESLNIGLDKIEEYGRDYEEE